MRAYLIVRPHSASDIDAAFASGADAVVLDGAGIKESAWLPAVRAASLAPRRSRLFVRVDAIDGPQREHALAAVLPLEPAAIVLPATHGRDIARVGARLAVHEAQTGRADGAMRIVGLVVNARGVLNATSFVDASPRLSGLAWDADAIADELGAERGDDAGGWSAALAQARGLVLLAAAAAGVEAIESAGSAGEDGFTRHVAAARRDGFGAALVTSPAQIPLVRAIPVQAGTARR